MSKIKTLRKIISALAAASVLTAASVLAYAGDVPDKPEISRDPNHLEVGTNSGTQVKVKYENKFDEAVYKVDMWWGSLQFEYSNGTWDPETHTYTRDEVLKPKNESDGKVTISNHSNVPVTVGVSYLHCGIYGGKGAEGSKAKISCGENSVICGNYDRTVTPFPEESNELRIELDACGIGAAEAPSAEVTVAPVVNDELVEFIDKSNVLDDTRTIGSLCIRFFDPDVPLETEP